MQYTILCVGKIKEKFYSDAIAEYRKRLSRYAKINVIEVADEKTPDRASSLEEDQIRKREGDRILGKIKDSMYVIALDLQGREYDSLAFADHLNKCLLQGKSHIVFVIGGSLGLSPAVLKRANERISFGRFTLPHQLMRLVLTEQIYRAFTIINGLPYHK